MPATVKFYCSGDSKGGLGSTKAPRMCCTIRLLEGIIFRGKKVKVDVFLTIGYMDPLI
jgi:hypothetical protein